MFDYEIATPTYRVCYRYIGNIGFIGGPRKTYSQQHKHGIGRDSTHEEAGLDSRRGMWLVSQKSPPPVDKP